MGPRQSKYGYLTVSPDGSGKDDDIHLKGVLAHAKRQSKGKISLAPVKGYDAEKKDQPKAQAPKKR